MQADLIPFISQVNWPTVSHNRSAWCGGRNRRVDGSWILLDFW